VTVLANGSGDLNWKATADLPWVALNPSAGQISPGKALTLGVQLAPDATVAAGSYQAHITFTAGSATTRVTLPVTLTDPPKLTLANAAITITKCGKPATDVVTNAGTIAVTNIAVSGSDPAVTAQIDATALDPGKTANLSVTLSCSASATQSYAVNLTSSAGNVTIQLTH
jgi:uncharacterized membrane protein